jgi:hypothetical protein
MDQVKEFFVDWKSVSVYHFDNGISLLNEVIIWIVLLLLARLCCEYPERG